MAEHDDRDEMPEVPEAFEPTVTEMAHSPLSTRVLVTAFLAGLVAAIAAGVVWGYIVKVSGYEIGVAAWGVGLVTGLAVLAASRGAKAVPLQAIAVVAALAGILVGKYMGFAFVIQESFGEIGLLSTEMREAFMDDLGAIFGAFDLLWVGFAVYTAWRLTRPEAAGG